jgi:hypothetical protein
VEWELEGEATTWEEQLQHHYAADPPFIVMSGAAGAAWPVIDAFCERERLPCILPVTDNPVSDNPGFYSLYLHAGAALEGRITARHMANVLGDGKAARVLVVRHSNAMTESAWESFRGEWSTRGAGDATELLIADGTHTDKRFWQHALRNSNADALVVWLDAVQLTGLHAALPRGSSIQVYTADAFTNWFSAPDVAGLFRQLWHIYPYRIADGKRVAFARESVWLKRNNLEHLDSRYASQALFACHVVGEQLAAIETNFSRDYFMEGLEHMLDGSNMTTILPGTTLAPGQRYLSHGAYALPPAALVSASSGGATWIEQ